MINQANRRPGHASYPSAIRSKPFAPVFTYSKELLNQSPAIVLDPTPQGQQLFGGAARLPVRLCDFSRGTRRHRPGRTQTLPAQEGRSEGSHGVRDALSADVDPVRAGRLLRLAGSEFDRPSQPPAAAGPADPGGCRISDARTRHRCRPRSSSGRGRAASST